MDAIFWLIPIAIFVLIIAIGAFIWAIKSEQFDDLESPAVKILFDDDLQQIEITKNTKSDDVENKKSQ